MSKSLLVISQNGCRPCGFVKNYLDHEDVGYSVLNVSEQPEYIEKYNIMSTPITILLDEQNNEIQRVAGYNPSQLEELIEQL